MEAVVQVCVNRMQICVCAVQARSPLFSLFVPPDLRLWLVQVMQQCQKKKRG